ncbi:MAG: acetolactate synthase small subunit [Candidatus Omnitrophica bacterium]|nr:acetolactate synthase small subunit [Candidatus Omnitrophota bacterium]MBU2043743.1 acetolactate synthase small subunit [Candidatus Omnitrophota bacterium]MBU2251736.1 acetolactate synthase small subunit [Candidatus Omnitrophota bacterium]MBU2473702.1 acetolactate synthase small subunit [Candidatus Omnitrophota bacterium]
MVKHTIQALVENKFGVLARVASLFSARGYNISSLAVGETQDPTISCMTIVVNAEDERILEQIKKQLHKLIDVVTVMDFTRKDYLDRELILAKLLKQKSSKDLLDKLAKTYGLKLVEETKDYYIVELSSESKKIEEALKELEVLNIKELVRTGRIAINK